MSNILLVGSGDRKFRDLGFLGIGSRLPEVLSGEIVGKIVGKGPSSTFELGTRVFSQSLFTLPKSGGLQEYTIINGEYAGRVPDGIPDTEAALYPINIVTAALGLFSSAGFDLPLPETPEAQEFDYASQKIVIIGGGSNVGRLAVQLAKLAGIGTVVVVASTSNRAVLQEYGATHVISREDSNIQEQVRALVGDDLFYVYDAWNYGDLSLGASLLSTSKRGVFAHNGSGEIPESILQQKKAGIEDKRILGFSSLLPKFGKLLWQKLPDWLEKAKIQALDYRVIEGLDEDRINYALDEYAAGRSAVRYHVSILD